MGSYADLLSAARAQPPRVALVLGSGLGGLADLLDHPLRVSFAEIPGLPAPSVHGHRGELLLGTWSGQPVLVFAGRVHYYEGHSWNAVVRPIDEARELGARVLLLTNAVGGIRDDLRGGALVALTDHFQWTGPFPWRQPGPGGIGPARPSPYSPRLIERLQIAAASLGEVLPTGVYAQLTGPMYETPAEIRALRTCSADVVGMSTAREIERGHELGLECAAISCVCNAAAGLGNGPISHDDVLDISAKLRQRLTRLIDRFLANLPLQ